MILPNLKAVSYWRYNQPFGVVATNGCFDLLHPGHLELLFLARRRGRCLIVGVNSDNSYHYNRGRFPIMNQEERAMMLDGVRWVDAVFIFDNCPNFLAAANPAHYVKGNGYTPDNLDPAEKAVLPIHCQIYCESPKNTLHSSDIINRVKLIC